MFRPLGIVLIAAMANVRQVHRADMDTAHVTRPALVEASKGPNGLTLYNAQGEAAAKCERKGDGFGKCKLEPRVTLDDLMNAWVHAYLDVQK